MIEKKPEEEGERKDNPSFSATIVDAKSAEQYRQYLQGQLEAIGKQLEGAKPPVVAEAEKLEKEA